MKRSTLICSAASLVVASTMVTAENAVNAKDWDAWQKDPHALEPCINGGVSAAGLYPSQEIASAVLLSVHGRATAERSTASR